MEQHLYMDDTYRQKAQELVAQMTLEEKAGLCSGEDCWNMKALERLGISTVTVMDGPHGLRKQIESKDNLGIGSSVPAVCFPTASALACSFDRELAYQVGRAIGEECVQENVAVILGPGANQKRSPLCGRNFEYYSEDPVLSGELAAAMIQGVQSTGTGTSLKHFAVNNQEKRRMTINALVDERCLRETYLKSFEIAIKKGKPASVMCAYNRLNGEYCSENKYLLMDILREEWGYEGVVISDWGAVHERALGIEAGLDIEMPGNKGFNDKKLIAAVKHGTLSEESLDRVACRVTQFLLKYSERNKNDYRYDKKEHHNLAIRAAEQSAVLLKNEGHILPGNTKQKVAIIGAFALAPRYQGAGSSKINPIKVDNVWDSFSEYGVNAVYAPGYTLDYFGEDASEDKRTRKQQDALLQEACEAVKDKELVYLFAGLPEGYESEGFDRRNMSLPKQQNLLIEAVSECNPNVVVILFGGAPLELPWIDKVKAVLLCYLGGEGVGRSVVNLLLGFEVPSGKLAETWPIQCKDNPSYHYYPGGRLTVEYRESIYVGYRYYEKAGKAVRYPFGHGLSYVDFKYSDMKLDCDTYKYGDKLQLTFSITNQGERSARETALIFVAHESDKVFIPVKELKEFVKVEMEAGETKQITVELDTRSFGYYNTVIKDWYAPSGSYRILVGASSQNCPLQATVYLKSPERQEPDYAKIAPSYFRLPQEEFNVLEQEFEALYGRKLPLSDNQAHRPYTMNNTIEEIRHTLIGKLLNKVADQVARNTAKSEDGQEGMMSATIKEMPFFAIVASDEKIITEKMMLGILDLLNGRYLKGLAKLLFK